MKEPTRKKIRDTLREDGIAGEIDDVVVEIMGIGQD